MRDEQRALDIPGALDEREALHRLNGFGHVLYAQHPRQLERRLRGRLRIRFDQTLALELLRVNVPRDGSEHDTRGVAVLESGDSRRVVTAEAVCHDANPARV